MWRRVLLGSTVAELTRISSNEFQGSLGAFWAFKGPQGGVFKVPEEGIKGREGSLKADVGLKGCFVAFKSLSRLLEAPKGLSMPLL